jgi:glucose/arabinose dehydrogenase
LGGDVHLFGEPSVRVPGFELETIVDGLSRPTGISFIGPDDLLVIEEDTGKVKRVLDGHVTQTVLDLDVATDDSRGLLGIDSTRNGNKTLVFLYLTESSLSDDEGETLGNRLYRYELSDDGDSLVNPKLLLSLPSGPGTMDNGGPVLVGPDSNIYLVVGQVQNENDIGHETKAQNFENGPDADGTSGVHRITQDGRVIAPRIFGSTDSMATYYAYGIRNSFGMDFDPINGNLWLSENGVYTNDEINLVEPGFNGGWKDVTGLVPDPDHDVLVTFNGSGRYSDPEFVWSNTVSPTAFLFFNSDKFGPEYKNDIFVGDYEFGRIYHFELNDERNALQLNGSLVVVLTEIGYIFDYSHGLHFSACP